MLRNQHGVDRVDVSDMANVADNLVESSYADPGVSGEEGEENSVERVAMDQGDAVNSGDDPRADSPALSAADPRRIRFPLESVIAGTSGIASTPIRTEQGPLLSGMPGSSVDIATQWRKSLEQLRWTPHRFASHDLLCRLDPRHNVGLAPQQDLRITSRDRRCIPTTPFGMHA
jgi:hypothetical protein